MNRSKRYVMPVLKEHPMLWSVIKVTDPDCYVMYQGEPGIYLLFGFNMLEDPALREVQDKASDVKTIDAGVLARFEEPWPGFIDNFLAGRYSKMYTFSDAERFFIHGSPEYMVVRKHEVYRSVFSRELGIELPKGSELESRPDIEQESL